MKEGFIKKLETENYLIGSFDVYYDEIKELIENDPDVDSEEILKSMPTAYRGAILSKEGEFIGYISLYNLDSKNGSSSIRMEVNEDLLNYKEVLNEYKKYLSDSLNITKIDNVTYIDPTTIMINAYKVETSPNVIITNNMLVPGISDEVLEEYSKEYNVPKLQMPFTIMNKDKVLGIIGLSNLIWSNKRANLNVFFNKEFGEDIVRELSSTVIDDYIDYVHSSNVHNINLVVPYSDSSMVDVIMNSNMNYYGSIPFGAYSNGNIESGLMFQHVPYMEKDNGILLPKNKSVSIDKFNTDRTELSSMIELDNGCKLISPKKLNEEQLKVVLKGHAKAMENRDKFTIPMGEDKYMLQVGNGNYGLSKAIANFDYLILDEKDNYVGYVNRLRENANNKNVEIEMGIAPEYQNRGVGTKTLNVLYNELFSIGYASITGSVFEFNKPSMKLCEKIAVLNGIRLDSYYINGKLWDMNIYTQINDVEKTGRRHM